jgi:Short C-terminal domain
MSSPASAAVFGLILSVLLSRQSGVVDPEGAKLAVKGLTTAQDHGETKSGDLRALESELAGRDGAASGRVVDLLERLAALRERGILTEDEFAAQKSAILAHGETCDS